MQGTKARWKPGGAQIEFPGGDPRDRQSRPGKLRLKRKGGTWGRKMQERRRLSHLWEGGVRRRARTQSPGPRVGGTRSRERCAGRGLFVCGLCSRSGPAPAPPLVRAPPPPALRVSGSPAPRGIAIRVPSLPLERALRAPCARTISLRDLGAGGGVRGRRGPATPNHLPASHSRRVLGPPRLRCPLLAGVGCHGEVPGRLREKRQRLPGGGAALALLSPSSPPLLFSIQPSGPPHPPA